MTYEIKIHHPDRNVDFYLSVEPYVDDEGRYVEPNEIVLDRYVMWIGKRGHEGEPLTNSDAKDAGWELGKQFAEEINEAVRSEIEKQMEVA